MIRFSIIVLLGAIAAGGIAAQLQGSTGNGVWAGYLMGASVTGLGLFFQRHTLTYRPEQVMLAVAGSFLMKLLFLLMGTLTFRFVDAAASLVDYRSFLVAYAAAVAILLPLGALDVAGRTRRGRRFIEPLESEGSL